jgi:hypothetical protein
LTDQGNFTTVNSSPQSFPFLLLFGAWGLLLFLGFMLELGNKHIFFFITGYRNCVLLGLLLMGPGILLRLIRKEKVKDVIYWNVTRHERVFRSMFA